MGSLIPLALHIKNMSSIDGVIINDLPEVVRIAGLPSYCYDMHTRLGKKAIAFLSNRVEVGSYLGKFGVLNKSKIVGWGTFYSEGGLLDCEIDYVGRTFVYETGYQVALAALGVPLSHAYECIGMVEELQPKLNSLRTDVIELFYK
jgi:hypothetical protein